MVSPPPYRRPLQPPDLVARIAFRSPGSGGRQAPVASGYRPNHDFGLPGELNDAEHEYPGIEWVQPGETVDALLWLFAPERQAGRLHPGFSFTIQERAHRGQRYDYHGFERHAQALGGAMSRHPDFLLTASLAPNNRLQRTVMDKVPRHIRQRAAAEPGRYTPD
jgi:hypothetical protein